MLLNRSSSLPQIKVNLNKYDNFFTKKKKISQMAMQENLQQIQDKQIVVIKDSKKKTHVKNLDYIKSKQTIKSKIQTFLNDGRKMGILDHSNNETNVQRSLTKISLQSLKPIRTQVDQQKAYLTQLKSQMNSYVQKNQVMQKQIKNCHALTTQVKQKIIFYEQLLGRSWQNKYQLLNSREQNLVFIRYQTDRLQYMYQRLKNVNIIMKKRVKDSQQKLRISEHSAKTLNEIEAVRQDELDNKIYLLKNYQQFQMHKSQNLGFKTQKAITSMQLTQAAQSLKHYQQSISIMQPDQYYREKLQQNHNKLLKDIILQKFYNKFLDSVWTKYSGYYQSYEKAQQLIKMYSMDRQRLVQDSYVLSFDVKKQIQLKIKQLEDKLQKAQKKNIQNKKIFSQIKYGQIEQIQKKIEQIQINNKKDPYKLKALKLNQEQKFHKSIIQRNQNIQRARKLSIRLRQWIVKSQKKIQLSVSKKSPLHEHFNTLFKFVEQQLKQIQPTYQPKKIQIKNQKIKNIKKTQSPSKRKIK